MEYKNGASVEWYWWEIKILEEKPVSVTTLFTTNPTQTGLWL